MRSALRCNAMVAFGGRFAAFEACGCGHSVCPTKAGAEVVSARAAATDSFAAMQSAAELRAHVGVAVSGAVPQAPVQLKGLIGLNDPVAGAVDVRRIVRSNSQWRPQRPGHSIRSILSAEQGLG